jgi:hypothetical protein
LDSSSESGIAVKQERERESKKSTKVKVKVKMKIRKTIKKVNTMSRNIIHIMFKHTFSEGCNLSATCRTAIGAAILMESREERFHESSRIHFAHVATLVNLSQTNAITEPKLIMSIFRMLI